ncbi:MAG: FHA domain-containing protein [Verrucomicrobia bacterium]|jgi:pSer/pThr/pTyr-binding forkhead associated (FHA) protein|nr:FHA domain-containing protein [Verrucomicrobiota bacterium]MDB4746403.1 FHA domain-containing protein [Verrucomicrobiota bacterium]
MLELRFHTWDGKPETYRLREGRTRVGRVSQNDLQIDDLALSAHHCEFLVSGNEVILKDVDSASGTFLDGELIEEAKVVSGQVINLGIFSIEAHAVSETPVESRNAQSLALPVQLEDGTYSCQSHTVNRAEYECENCFALFCSKCFQGSLTDRVALHCPRCEQALKAVDWSGMGRTRQDVVKGILPDSVKRTLNYWQKYQDWEQNRKGKP